MPCLFNCLMFNAKGSHPKKRIYKDICFICFDPLPPAPNKDIKNKYILLNYLDRWTICFWFFKKNQILIFQATISMGQASLWTN